MDNLLMSHRSKHILRISSEGIPLKLAGVEIVGIMNISNFVKYFGYDRDVESMF